VAYLAERGTRRIVGRVMRENHAMRGLAEALGFVRQADPATDADEIVFVLDLTAKHD